MLRCSAVAKKVGFARLSASDRAKLGRRGGKAAHRTGGAHQFTTAEAEKAGKKGAAARWGDEKEDEEEK